jgi:hypothetical protein
MPFSSTPGFSTKRPLSTMSRPGFGLTARSVGTAGRRLRRSAYWFRSAKTGASASRECNSCEGVGSLAFMYPRSGCRR